MASALDTPRPQRTNQQSRGIAEYLMHHAHAAYPCAYTRIASPLAHRMAHWWCMAYRSHQEIQVKPPEQLSRQPISRAHSWELKLGLRGSLFVDEERRIEILVLRWILLEK